MQTVASTEAFSRILQTDKACLFYFSHEHCQVCKVLKPKTREMMEAEFPGVSLYYVDVKLSPDVAAQQSVLTVPTLLIYLEGKEQLRASRHISLDHLKQQVSRWYGLLFN